MTTISVGVVEDDPEMRAYLVQMIDEAEDLALAFACGTYAEAVNSLATHSDVCLVDIRLPDGNGIDFIRKLRESGDSKSLILTVLGDRASVLLAFEVGANGYLLKDTPSDQICRDIRALVAGGNPISPQAAFHVIQMMGKKSGHDAAVSQTIDHDLTPRELDVLTMFSRGLSYKEAAAALGMSINTVSGHVKSIYSKMSVHSRNEAIFEAVQNGWLEL
ncbi:response regulator [Porphyrobacter sp. AAP60]|uniref:response regulator n=1 Tax=Porphyrobacter sp. AAP60 TaxID=1523423 RepID=UPI0006B9C7B8|nr:response regulator transcription factor [Porphyrobacter sp. AAP60]KPF62002.1 hypothetical protein IP79_14165 [Porphyrobacter sp. AAP60]